MDVNDHQFRLKLVCILLTTCGMYMKSGSSKKKLDYFLAYYQMYYWKIRASCDIPEEVNFFREITQIINDTFATVNPSLKLSKSIEEAEKAVKTGEEEILKSLKVKAPQLLQAIGLGASSDSNIEGLHTIMEEDDTEELNVEKLCDEDVKEDDAENESYDESGSDFGDVEEYEVNNADVDEDSTTEEDEDSAEEPEDGDEVMDSEDDESDRKELETDMEEWSVKSKPKLIGN